MSNVYFKHIRKPKHDYTAAYEFVKDDNGIVTVSYGIAQCNKKDQYSKELGRSIAAGRLSKAVIHKTENLYHKSFSFKDDGQLNVGRRVTAHFEAERDKTMRQHNTQY